MAALPEQGWSLLCNGVVLFEDYGELLPDGSVRQPPHSRGALARAREVDPIQIVDPR